MDRPSLVLRPPRDTVLGEAKRRAPGVEVICKSPVTVLRGLLRRYANRLGPARYFSDVPGSGIFLGRAAQPAASAEIRPAASGSARPRPTATPTR